jgi:hypothetical protein
MREHLRFHLHLQKQKRRLKLKHEQMPNQRSNLSRRGWKY